MSYIFFQKVFQNLQTPVVICGDQSDQPVVFANVSAKILLYPQINTGNLKEGATAGTLCEMLRFRDKRHRDHLFAQLRIAGSVDNYRTDILTFEDAAISVSLSVNTVELEDKNYFVFYIYEAGAADSSSSAEANSMLFTSFQMALHMDNLEDAVNGILGYVGGYVHVSRAYIFESISEEYTRNTYEWCAKGVEPAIDGLQNLKKSDYNYDVIVSAGMYITDDIQELPDNDREILEAQGIRALAIIPLVSVEGPLGYVGFDDCENCRHWSSGEIHLLKNTANILVSLLIRRNAERQVKRSKEILQTISDNMDSVIYVSDIKSYELVFVNKTLADSLGKRTDALLGKACWSVLQKGMDGPCPFCPIPHLMGEGGERLTDTHTWDFRNTHNNKWYLVRDSIIKWIDGRDVHIETATEITHQKEYEEQLKFYASTDTMTGAYNREWGYKIMQDMAEAHRGATISLVFIDLDGLKRVNDSYGHDAGDTMICRTVETIRSCIRSADVICRWGGDEFLLLIPCDTRKAGEIVEKIVNQLEQLNQKRIYPYRLSFSYGIAPLNAGSIAAIDASIGYADKMMYQNKTAKS